MSSLPFRIAIALTENCNFRCTMCDQSANPRYARYEPGYNMQLSLFERLAEELFPTALNVDLRGFGETTVLPQWPDIVGSLHRFPWIEWNLVTNLSLRRDDVWAKMLDKNFVIGASIDGATAETFEAIRRGSVFSVIRHNLALLADARRRQLPGYAYFISVIQKSNAHEMRGIVELAADHEISEVQFHVVRSFDSVQLEGPMVLDRMKLPRYVAEAVDCALERGVTLTFNAPIFTRRLSAETLKKVGTAHRPGLSQSLFHGAPWAHSVEGYATRLVDAYRVMIHQKCLKPFAFFDINHQGVVGTCNHMQQPNPPVMGDLTKDTLDSVWNGERFREFRRQLVTAQPKDSRCQWCFANRLTD